MQNADEGGDAEYKWAGEGRQRREGDADGEGGRDKIYPDDEMWK